MPKKAYRVRNWKEYNKGLIKRGSITFWFDEEAILQWKSTNKRPGGRGRQEEYSDMSIECALTLRAVFKLTLRSTEGFIADIIKLMNLPIKTPNYTTLCKRQKDLLVKLKKFERMSKEGLHLAFDSTGLKVFGEGEWKVRQHGLEKKRVWRKLHLAVNLKTQEIESCITTDAGMQDCQGLPKLLETIPGKIDSMIGDGAYDRFSCYEEAQRRESECIFPPQHNAKTSKERPRNKKKASVDAVAKRDEVICKRKELGQAQWKKDSGYHRRSLAETAMFRIKQLFGGKLCARKAVQQEVEVRIWCQSLNKMNTLGMPRTVAI